MSANRPGPPATGKDVMRPIVLFVALVLVVPGSAGPEAAPGRARRVDVPEAVRPPVRLTDPSLAAGRPAWSPDGTRIVFQAGADGAGDVWVVGLDGRAPTRLTDHAKDDREPTWLPDGRTVLFASNRDGDYDLWTVPATGGAATRLLHLPGDEREPTVSPLEYSFHAVIRDGCQRSGVSERQVDRYGKVAYTRHHEGTTEVWFVAMNGRHKGRLSPRGKVCSAPSFAGNGLALAWQCSDGPGGLVFDTEARTDPSFAAALEAIGGGQGEGCQEEELEDWEKSECLRKLPRRYTRHVPTALSKSADALATPAYSANQTLFLAARTAGDDALRYRFRASASGWKAQPLGVTGVRGLVWAPDGKRVAFQADAEGRPAVFVAETDFYLQEVRNLVEFPELVGARASALLHRNRFVARPSDTKEFFAYYEKCHYERRPVFLTTDAVLQVFHDEFTRFLKTKEIEAAGLAGDVAKALTVHYAERFATTGEAVDRYLALHFAVPSVFLQAGGGISTARGDADGWVDPEAPAPAPALAQYEAALPKALATVPAAIRADVEALVRTANAHADFGTIDVPGYAEPVPVDWTRFKVRGAYATNGLAGYFQAMVWWSLLPLPNDAATFRLVDELAGMRDGGQGTTTLAAEWDAIDAFVGAFMGRPADATITHLRTLAKEQPGLLAPYDAVGVAAALEKLRGPVPYRGLAVALGQSDARGVPVHFFPLRQGLDVEALSALTHPNIERRGIPTALDVLAVSGSERAKVAAVAREEALVASGAELGGPERVAAYRALLDKLTGEMSGRVRAYASTDIYHGWLAALATLATAPELAKDSPLAFARNTAWADRLVHSALAGYTQLKHNAVLYAFQEYGAECADERPVLLFVEMPILPLPRGFVDPHPKFFGALAGLAERVTTTLAGGVEPTVGDYQQLFTEEWGEAVPYGAARLARRLEALAKAEVEGRPLALEDYTWMLKFGPILEALFRGKTPEDGGALANDEGRLARGIALVTDIYTNVDRGVVVQEAIGRLLHLFVVVPDTVGQRLTQGAIFSHYEFTQPTGERLDNEEWNQRLEQGQAPAPLPFTKSFLEP